MLTLTARLGGKLLFDCTEVIERDSNFLKVFVDKFLPRYQKTSKILNE